MLNLVLAILFSSILFIVLKSFSRFTVNTLHAIVINYIVAYSVGIINLAQPVPFRETIQKPWFFGCFYLGVLFIAIFFIIGKTSQKNGVSVASVASKMSLVIPILFGIFYFKEEISYIKVIGICIALIAVYFTTKKNENSVEVSSFFYPVMLFLGSGIIDTSMNFFQEKWVSTEEIGLFSSIIFLIAFFIGLLIITYQIIQKKFKFEFKSFIGGLLLGIPNYYSLYFLIRALQNETYESATLFTIINIGVILVTTLFGLLLFKEKLHKHNYIGIILAILALFLVTY